MLVGTRWEVTRLRWGGRKLSRFLQGLTCPSAEGTAVGGSKDLEGWDFRA